MAQFSPANFLFRWLIAFLLVTLTFNPTEWSFYHWVAANPQHMLPGKLLVGLILLVAYIVFLRATWRSIGLLGIVLTIAICGTVVWLLIDVQWLDINQQVLSWLALLIAATVLAVGISWSHIRRRWTGQVDADDLED